MLTNLEIPRALFLSAFLIVYPVFGVGCQMFSHLISAMGGIPNIIIVHVSGTQEANYSIAGWELTDDSNVAAIKRRDVFADLTTNQLTPPYLPDFKYTRDLVIDTVINRV